jgi:hypothetical protein
MATTYEAIATVTVGSGGAATIEFTSIPGTYTDLVIKLSSRTDRVATNADCFLKFNNNTSNYTVRKLYGAGGGANTGSQSSPAQGIGTSNGSNNTASTFASTEIYIPNYTSSNNKSYSVDAVQESNDASGNIYATLLAGLWSNTSAITSITLYIEESKNWVQYSTATLYGIKNT